MTNHATLVSSHWTLSGPGRPFEGTEVSPWDIRDRISAAHSAGFRGFGFSSRDLMGWRDTLGYPAIRAALDGGEMRHREAEMIFDWWTDGERRQASNHVRDDLRDAAEELGLTLVKVGPAFVGEDVSLDRYAEGFAELCDVYADVGARVALEFLPFSAVSTPSAALDIAEQAGRPNGGLVVDLWHVERGGVSLKDVSSIPVERLMHVELCDAASAMPSDLVEDTLDHRLLCGEGDFDIRGFLDSVRDTGYGGAYGVEILSLEQRARPLSVAATAAFDTALAQFDHAGRRHISAL